MSCPFIDALAIPGVLEENILSPKKYHRPPTECCKINCHTARLLSTKIPMGKATDKKSTTCMLWLATYHPKKTNSRSFTRPYNPTAGEREKKTFKESKAKTPNIPNHHFHMSLRGA